MIDNVNHPLHYTRYKFEVIELTENMTFCLGNAVKYILRAPFKGREIEDLNKSLWYVKRELDLDQLVSHGMNSAFDWFFEQNDIPHEHILKSLMLAHVTGEKKYLIRARNELMEELDFVGK